MQRPRHRSDLPTVEDARHGHASRRRRILNSALGGLMVLVLLTPTAAGAQAGQRDWELCAWHTDQVEKSEGLPPYILTAISKVESGRWSDDAAEMVAWPWTVRAEGHGQYLPNKQAAIREVERLRAKGIESIDVGCMQVNLLHHPRAFKDLEAAFDPAANIAYAAGFLSRLQASLHSWPKAIGRYHSSSIEFSGSYRFKVLRAWRKERQRAWQVRRDLLSSHGPT